jgi:uncharacterized membrane protein
MKKWINKILHRDKVRSVPSWWLFVMIILAVFGVMDTQYLLTKSQEKESVVCFFSEDPNSCNSVLDSKYSTLFGVHLSVYGLCYYIFVFIFILLFNASKERRYFNLLFLATGWGLLFSIWLTYLQVFVLHNLCFYCIISGLISTMLFITNGIYIKFYKNINKNFSL